MTSPSATARPAAPAGEQALKASALSASITVKDVERSLAWYSDVVGFAVDQRYEREGKLAGVALAAGDVRILLNQDDGKKGWDRAKGEGMSLMITTTQDVDAIAKRITGKGGSLDSPPADMPWGMRMFRVQDPDGFKIAFARPVDAAGGA